MEINRTTNLSTIYKVPNEKSVAYLNIQGKTVPISISESVATNPSLEKVCNFEFDDQLLTGVSNTIEGYMYVNGVKGKKTERLSLRPKFSKDGNHFAYTITDTSFIQVEGSDRKNIIMKNTTIVDNTEYGPYDEINNDFIFSSNSKNWAFSANIDPNRYLPVALSSMFGGINIAHSASTIKKHFVVLNGQKQKEYPVISCPPKFSPDGERLAYIARVGKVNHPIVNAAFGSVNPELVKMSREQIFKDTKFIAVVDGIESKEYDNIKDIQFSPDGKQHVHDATIGDKSFLVINGQELPKTHDGIFKIAYSSNGQLFCMVGDKSKGKYCVVIDGVEQKFYDFIDPSSFTFSENGNHHAYIVTIGTKYCIVLDGHESGLHESIDANSLVFSPDGTKFGFIVKEGKKQRVIIDGNDQKLYDNVFTPVFSPNGQRFAYKAINDGKNFAVIDGIEQEQYIFILDRFYFSPDSKNVAYIVGIQEGVLIIMNQKKVRIVVSVVINKTRGDTFNQILEPPEGNLVWKTNSSLHYVTVKRVEDFIHIYRVEDQLKDF